MMKRFLENLVLLIAALVFGGALLAFANTLQGEASSAPTPAVGQAKGNLEYCYPPAVMRWRDNILRWAREYGLDPDLVATLMTLESGGDSRAKSYMGALGLFQVMPDHFTPQEDPFDPETNARRGLTYLRARLKQSGGDVLRALAGYNGGPGVVPLPFGQMPAETQLFVQRGNAILEALHAGKCKGVK